MKDEEKEVRRQCDFAFEQGRKQGLAESEEVRARDADRIAELEREVAMLRAAISETKSLLAAAMHEPRPAKEFETEINRLNDALSATQSTAEQYEARVRAEALEEFSREIRDQISYSDVDDPRFENGKEAVAAYAVRMAAELRAKGGE